METGAISSARVSKTSGGRPFPIGLLGLNRCLSTKVWPGGGNVWDPKHEPLDNICQENCEHEQRGQQRQRRESNKTSSFRMAHGRLETQDFATTKACCSAGKPNGFIRVMTSGGR